MRKFFMRVSLISATFFLCATIMYAHGNSFSYEETKDGYLIDIGYDEFIAADESVRFDFTIYPENIEAINTNEELFTDVWVTVTQNKKAYFAGGIDKPAFGSTGFTYAFPKEGEYILSARFQKDGETVVATEIPLTIIEALDEAPGLPPLVLNTLFVLAGIFMGFAARLLTSKK